MLDYYRGELKERPERKFILSQVLISRAMDQIANCSDFTRRACEGGFKVVTVYSQLRRLITIKQRQIHKT